MQNSLSIHSLAQCVDSLHHTVSMLTSSIQASHNLLQSPKHSRIRVQSEYAWISQTQLSEHLRKWELSINPFISCIEHSINQDIQLLIQERDQLSQEWEHHEMRLLDLERQRQEEMVIRRIECQQKKKILETKYKQLLSEVEQQYQKPFST
jgi:hypothetical protein